jgi:hypothetical protein
LLGLAAAAGDGDTPAATDTLSKILDACFGAGTATNGEGVGAGSAVDSIVMDTAIWAANALVCIADANANSGRAQWRRVTGATTPYTPAPANLAAAPTTTGIGYGTIHHAGFSDDGYSLSAVIDIDGIFYYLSGGRPTSLKITGESGQRCTVDVGMRFDSKAEQTATKTTLTAYAISAHTPIKGALSPFYWGASAYAIKSLELDFGLTVADDESTAGANGRQDIQVLAADPVLRITPRYDQSVWEADFLAGTTREALVAFGAGAISGGVLNTCAFSCAAAQVRAVTEQADGKRLRHQIELVVRDNGASSDYWRFARA